jgi:uncharacterized membrane protein
MMATLTVWKFASADGAAATEATIQNLQKQELIKVGIDDDFIKSVRGEIEPGTSALFLMSSDAVLDKVKAAFGDTFVGGRPQLIHTNLSDAQEAALRQVFGE